MSQKNREPGYYWVKFHEINYYEVAEFSESGVWYICGCERLCVDEEMDEVDEHRIVREEPTE